MILFKTLLILVISLSLIPSVLAQTQSHPLSQLTPIDTNLNMNLSGTAYNITNISWITYSGGIVFAGTRGIPTNDIQDSAITSSKIAAAVALTGNVSIDSPTFFVDSSNDRVGIGTTGPGQKLEIAGSDPIVFINDSDGAGGARLRFDSAHASVKDFDIGIKGTNLFYIRDITAATDRLVIDNTGNVGIGTTSPSGKLHINGSTGSGVYNFLNLEGTGTGAQTWTIYPSTTQGLTLIRPGLRLAAFLNDGSFAAGGLSDDAGLGADIFVNGTSGNVGIGTTNPDSTLHVIGGVCAETSDTGCAAVAGYVRGNTGLCMGSDCKTSWSQVGGVSPWDNSSTQIFVTNGYPLYVNASNTLFVNGTSGNVGIGTPNPGAKLEVAGQVKITGGVPGAGKVLTSDAAGLATWATPTGVPSGVIVMWSGLLENIPAGWALCDGTNGTPDLRDKFIYGTSAGETPGATGGANSYTLTTAQLPSHTHAISEDGTHTHQVVRKISTAGGGTGLLTESPVENAFASGLTQGSGSHSHGGATGSAGSGNSIDNRPSFVKLAFIMKL